MQEHELEEILYELGLQKIRKIHGRKGVNFQFLCPFHGESRPSAGVVLDGNSAYGQCYSCGETFTLAKLIAHCNGIRIYEAINWLDERFSITKKEIKQISHLKRWDDVRESDKRVEFPITKIAPYRSGKETHNYFFDRGFSDETAKDFLIGWDKLKYRITIPVFHLDGKLAGVIGRAVLEPKINGEDNKEYLAVYGRSPKYYIYDNFPISHVLFGSHCFESRDKTVIIVEGTFDLLWMHQHGFKNTLSTIVAKNFSQHHIDILNFIGTESLVLMLDNDSAGEMGATQIYKKAKDYFKIYRVIFPRKVKDVMELNKDQLATIIENKVPFSYRKLKRIF